MDKQVMKNTKCSMGVKKATKKYDWEKYLNAEHWNSELGACKTTMSKLKAMHPGEPDNNWRKAFIELQSEMADVMTRCAEQIRVMDRAYKEELEEVKNEMEEVMAAGYEEAYQMLRESSLEKEELKDKLFKYENQSSS